jgi:hypothetical protein
MINPKAAVTLELAEKGTAEPLGRPARPGWPRQLTIALVVVFRTLMLGVVIGHTGARARATRSEGPALRFVGVSRAPAAAADTRGEVAFDCGGTDDEAEDRGAEGTEREAAGSAGPARRP